MTDTIEFKRGDTAATAKATLYADDAKTTAVNLTGCTVKFIMALTPKQPGQTKVNAAASILDPTSGRVAYAWLANDVDTAGNYNAEWEVTFSDGTVQTFPRKGYLTVSITEDLD